MTAISVNTDIVNSDAAAAYFNRADRRIKAGMRVTLEMLGIPLPGYAERLPAGAKPSKAIAAAFSRDNPAPPPTLHYKSHDPASPQRVATVRAKRLAAAQTKAQARRGRTQRPGGDIPAHTLFNDVFGG